MRDDLHKSFSPRTKWAKVLRLACQHAPNTDVVLALGGAIRADASTWLDTPWGRDFLAATSHAGDDFFAEDRARAQLSALADAADGPYARAACELALGRLARDQGVSETFQADVLHDAMRTFAEDSVELAVSRIAAKFGHVQANLARKKLTALMPECDFTSGTSTSHDTAPISVLDIVLPLKR